MNFEQCVADDSLARMVDLLVVMLPLKDLGFTDTPVEEGRPPYHPGDLLKLYLYGYGHCAGPSRKLAHACEVNLEVIYLSESSRRKSTTRRKEFGLLSVIPADIIASV